VEYGSVSLFNFYIASTLRIWPVLLRTLHQLGPLGTHGTALFAVVWKCMHQPALGRLSLTYLLFLGNWIILPCPPPWAHVSIAWKEQFYILFPADVRFLAEEVSLIVARGHRLAVCIVSRPSLPVGCLTYDLREYHHAWRQSFDRAHCSRKLFILFIHY